MTATVSHGEELFKNAPPRRLERRLGVPVQTGRRALLVALVAWVPLVLLAIVQSFIFGSDELRSLLRETGVHARYLVAAPLLVLAEAICAPKLGAIANHFVHASLVPNEQRGHFDAALASTRRLLESHTAEIVVVALAYCVVVISAVSHQGNIPNWHLGGGTPPLFSMAGWWHLLISLPLLLMLIFAWMWRLALWARLLWLVSRLDLRLVASHPDHTAGLSFLGHSLRAFAIVALALAAIAAGRSAHIVLEGGGLPTPQLAFNVSFLIALLALFTGPLLVFAPVLRDVWLRGTLEYGALAERVGKAFEDKWLTKGKSADPAALDQPDFSATTDLYQVVSNVYAIRLVPVDLKDLIALAIAVLIPFVPVVLLAVPTDVIWSGIKSLLF
ncbi:MAG TPA: hypothetical protein VEA77_03445 [Hyphomicrobium sp.]|nr:hypothetical protein [Hyphomicrobium sp.]